MVYKLTFQTYVDKSYFFAELSKYEFIAYPTHNRDRQFNLNFGSNDVTPLL